MTSNAILTRGWTVLLASAALLSAPAAAPAQAPAASAPAAATTDPSAPSAEAHLERLAERLDAQREKLHVPGMAIAVVHDDRIVLARGFGTANLETGEPVTAETLFAIGSSTKAFTAALVAMLVDEGRMSWDDPVTKHLPYFTLAIDSPDAAAEVTIRDLLCHRTGFTRMGILWAAGGVDRETVLRTATKAEPTDPFRAKWRYNNVMFLAAGVASAQAAGTTWDALLAERLLEPLGMSSSNTSVRRSQTDPRLALGYIWDADRGVFKHLPMRVLDTIAPAGAINSNVLDMAQWVRFQLARGEHDGRRLVSAEQLEETWAPQMKMGEQGAYGLGWMLREWKGRRLIEHGGNIDGFGAKVALLPDSNVGFVMLTNVTATPLVELAMEEVWTAVLEPPAPVVAGGENADVDLAPYVGTYVGNFAHFSDEDFEVVEQDGRLAVDVPGQQVFELKPPDDEGKWYFFITDQIAVSFDRDERQRVTGMKMHQGGMAFELPRRGVEIEPEIALEELERYLGRYRSENLGVEVEVKISNNRLALDVPGQMVFELLPPEGDEVWRLRVRPELAEITFNPGADGRIESLTNVQGGVTEVMPLVRAAGETATVSLQEILDLRGSDRLGNARAELGTIRITGTVRLVNAGVEGTITTVGAADGRHRLDADFGQFGHTRLVVGAEGAWSESSFAPFDDLHGELLAQARQSHPAALFGDWSDFFDEISLRPDRDLDGRRVHVVKLQSGEAPAVTVLLDPATGDPLRLDTLVMMPGIGGIPVESSFEDFRDVGGLRVPFRIIEENQAMGRSIVEITGVETNVPVGPETFTLSPSTP